MLVILFLLSSLPATCRCLCTGIGSESHDGPTVEPTWAFLCPNGSGRMTEYAQLFDPEPSGRWTYDRICLSLVRDASQENITVSLAMRRLRSPDGMPGEPVAISGPLSVLASPVCAYVELDVTDRNFTVPAGAGPIWISAVVGDCAAAGPAESPRLCHSLDGEGTPSVARSPLVAVDEWIDVSTYSASHVSLCIRAVGAKAPGVSSGSNLPVIGSSSMGQGPIGVGTLVASASAASALALLCLGGIAIGLRWRKRRRTKRRGRQKDEKENVTERARRALGGAVSMEMMPIRQVGADQENPPFQSLPPVMIEVNPSVVTFGSETNRIPVGSFSSTRFSIGNASTETLLVDPVASNCRKALLMVERGPYKVAPGDEVLVTAEINPSCGSREIATTVMISASKVSKRLRTGERGRYVRAAAGFSALVDVKAYPEPGSQLDPDEIEVEDRPIGRGGYADVFKGRWRNQVVAVKKMRDVHLQQEILDEFVREIKLITQMRSPHVVLCYGAVTLPGEMCIVTEFVTRGSLEIVLRSGEITPALGRLFALDMASGLAFLHDAQDIIHRDLKPGNVLVVSVDPTAEVRCKLTDFGCARFAMKSGMSSAMTQAVGTPLYMAPEALDGNTYSTKADIYSLAMIMYEMEAGRKPFDDILPIHTVVSMVLDGRRPAIPPECPAEYANLIRDCWIHIPDSRPEAALVRERLGLIVRK
jgi:tRNA A-37 threonylcarbamoyl transferase component Bud32